MAPGKLGEPIQCGYRKLPARSTDLWGPVGRPIDVIGFCSAIIVMRALLAEARSEHPVVSVGGRSQPTTDARKPMMNHQALQRAPDGWAGPGATISSLGSAPFSGLFEGSRESGRTGRGARALTVSGVTDLGPVPEHTLCIHLGRPTLVNCRLDDLMQNSRRQARGDMDIVPLGSSIC